MKQIENLLAEYKIRFRDTDRILEDGYPFKCDLLNGDIYENIVSEDFMSNENGKVYSEGIWATADIKIKPDKWVVEMNQKSKYFDDFLTWFHFEYDDEKFISFNKEQSDCLLDFSDHQYLTLDQWHDLVYLPKQNKVDFSILNNEDWFYMEITSFRYLFKGGNPFEIPITLYDIRMRDLTFDNRWSEFDKGIARILRKATPEDLIPLYKNHPELEPPKVGDLCIFFDLKYQLIINLTINYLNSIRDNNTFRYESNNVGWKYAMKVLPTWGYDAILERYETYKKVML